MKYIDVDLLWKEVEFAKSVYDNPKRVVHGVADAFRQDGRAAMCDDILKILDSLQKEQPTRGYDEAYLNECIAKARQTWKGVDVDKYMDEMRRREQEQPDAKLDSSIVNEWASRFSPENLDGIKSTAYHFWNMANGVKDSKLEL